MNKKIKRMIEEVELRGGTIAFESNAPDELMERFLTEVLDCPDCREEAARRAGRNVPPARADH